MLDDIRTEIWLKLWGNLSFNPISALIACDAGGASAPSSRSRATSPRAMMREAAAVAAKLGTTFRVPLEQAHRRRRARGPPQDLDAPGRRVRPGPELDALLGSVIELARLTGTPVPHLEAVYACAALLERTVCKPGRAAAPAPAGVLAEKAA